MKKFLIILIIVVLAAWAFMGGDDASDAEMTDGHDHAPVTVDGVYAVDLSTSTIAWTGRKSFVDGYEDTGTIGLKSGSFTVTDGKLSGATFVVDMTTIETVATGLGSGEANLTKHLKSDEFFGVEEYPEATFELGTSSDAIKEATIVTDQEEGDEEPEWDGVTYEVTGDLTIKGTTEPVTFIVELFEEEGMVFVEATMSVDRSKYDVQYGSGSFFEDLGDKTIDDIFTLDISLVASQETDMENDGEMSKEDTEENTDEDATEETEE